jgi:predicted RNA-binding protein (virulence factor B family)
LHVLALDIQATKATGVHLKSGLAPNLLYSMSDDQNSELERRIAGRTLQVYLYLQKKKEASGIREVQRDLALSSPSVAEY